jgi:hypothetical protein
MLCPQGFAPLSLETLPTVPGEIRTAGFSAVMTDIPGGMPVGDYADLLAAADLAPAPPERPATRSTPMSRSRASPAGAAFPLEGRRADRRPHPRATRMAATTRR